MYCIKVIVIDCRDFTMLKSKKISVIVPTYNGEKKIGVLLNALKKQTTHDFELLIMIDGSTDGTRHIVEQFEFEFPVRIFDQPNSGRAIVKNNGASKAAGDLLIFYDDDMEPSPDSVERHALFHQNNRGLVCGYPVELEHLSQGDMQNYKAALSVNWMAKYTKGLNQMRMDNLFFTASTFSVLKDTFVTLGGFDARLTDAEDYDFAYRALEIGIPVYLDTDNRSIHHDRITCFSYVKRIRQYSKAHSNLNILHPDRVVIRATGQSVIRKPFYFIFSFPFWISWVDQERLRFLPRAWRFKIYDWITFSLGYVFKERKLE